MNLCRITNLMSMDVRLEDLGVHLSGRGSSTVVNEEAASRSRDLQAHRSWVRVDSIPDPRQVPRPVPVWPFIKDPPVPPLAPVPAAERRIVPPSGSAIAPPPAQDLSSIEKSLEELKSMMASLMGSGARAPGPIPGLSASASDEPLFIPQKIVPSSVETHITVSEQTAEKQDFEDAQEALRKMRRKK